MQLVDIDQECVFLNTCSERRAQQHAVIKPVSCPLIVQADMF